MNYSLTPQPQKIEEKEGEFSLQQGINICLQGDLYYKLEPALEILNNTLIQELDIKINCVGKKDRANLFIELTDDQSLVARTGINFQGLTDEEKNEKLAQAYLLEICQEKIIIKAADLQGIGYALMTLNQLFYHRQNNQELEAVKITDYPAIIYRGIMLDVSRGRVPKNSTIFEIIDLLYKYKINVLQLYVEDSYFFPSLPDIGKRKKRITESDIRKIDSYCRQRAIDFQPNLQTFSHFHGILRMPEYKHLAENDTLWTLAPLKPESYDLLERMINDFLQGFSSSTMHINMDEAYDIGTGHSREQANKAGVKNVYLKHLMKVYSLVKSQGINKVLFWGDMLNKYPKLLKKLPEDLVPVSWDYSPEIDEEQLQKFRDSQLSSREFWVAPGTSSWNSIFPRMSNALSNIKELARQGSSYEARGFLTTDWGDYGHLNSLGLSFPCYIYAAEAGWSLSSVNLDDFLDKLTGVNYLNTRQKKTIKLLNKSNEGLTDPFKTYSLYAFFDDLIAGKSIAGKEDAASISQEKFSMLYQYGQQAWLNTRKMNNTLWNQELSLAARMTKFTGKKGLLTYDIRKNFQENEINEEYLLEKINQIKLLHQELDMIRYEVFDVWKQRSHLDGLENVSYYFSKTATQFSKTVIWLNEQRKSICKGKEPDREFGSYEGADYFTTLWTQDFDNLWDIAYPWS